MNTKIKGRKLRHPVGQGIAVLGGLDQETCLYLPMTLAANDLGEYELI